MTTLEELLRAHDRLTVVHVERWVARGLLRPSADGENWVFEPVDVARARLLADLTDQMGFDDESVETVVDLLDQVHTLRRKLAGVPADKALGALLKALQRQVISGGAPDID